MADDKPKKPASGETHHYTEEDLLRDQFEKQKQGEKADSDAEKAPKSGDKG